jgi:integrase
VDNNGSVRQQAWRALSFNHSKFHAVLREAFQTAARWRVLPFNAAEHVDLPRRRPRTMAALTRQQSAKLLHAVTNNQNHHQLRLPIVLMLFCGLRRSQLLALRWSTIDWYAKSLRIEAALERTRCNALTFEPPKNG